MNQRPSIPQLACALALALALSACASAPPPPPPLPAPRIVRSVRALRGEALADDAAAPVTTASLPWVATLRLIALERLPSERGAPLIERSRLVTHSESETLLQIDLSLLAGARCEDLGAVNPAAFAADLARGRGTDCGLLSGALYPGSCLVFQLGVERFLEGNATREFIRLRVSLGAPGKGLEVALLTRRARLEGGELSTREELALLHPLQAPRLALYCPATFDPGYQGYALVLSVEEGDATPGQALLYADALSELQRGSVAPISSSGAPASPATLAPLVQAALSPESEPAAWARLCAAARAPLATHLTYAASPELLSEVIRAWRAALDARTQSSVVWRLERGALEVLLASAAPAARALLIEECGAVGADPTLLRDGLEVTSELADWEALLQSENLYLLKHLRARVRARAHTWLRRRGLAVPAYEPLAPAAARRAALRTWEQQGS